MSVLDDIFARDLHEAPSFEPTVADPALAASQRELASLEDQYRKLYHDSKTKRRSLQRTYLLFAGMFAVLSLVLFVCVLVRLILMSALSFLPETLERRNRYRQDLRDFGHNRNVARSARSRALKRTLDQLDIVTKRVLDSCYGEVVAVRNRVNAILQSYTVSPYTPPQTHDIPTQFIPIPRTQIPSTLRPPRVNPATAQIVDRTGAIHFARPPRRVIEQPKPKSPTKVMKPRLASTPKVSKRGSWIPQTNLMTILGVPVLLAILLSQFSGFNLNRITDPSGGANPGTNQPNTQSLVPPSGGKDSPKIVPKSLVTPPTFRLTATYIPAWLPDSVKQWDGQFKAAAHNPKTDAVKPKAGANGANLVKGVFQTKISVGLLAVIAGYESAGLARYDDYVLDVNGRKVSTKRFGVIPIDVKNATIYAKKMGMTAYDGYNPAQNIPVAFRIANEIEVSLLMGDDKDLTKLLGRNNLARAKLYTAKEAPLRIAQGETCTAVEQKAVGSSANVVDFLKLWAPSWTCKHRLIITLLFADSQARSSSLYSGKNGILTWDAYRPKAEAAAAALAGTR